jgi:hypothetical protein
MVTGVGRGWSSAGLEAAQSATGGHRRHVDSLASPIVTIHPDDRGRVLNVRGSPASRVEHGTTTRKRLELRTY